MENLIRLINELRSLKTETAWVEFKHNNYDPEMIGKDISALANGAALHDKNMAYMLWGIDNSTHEIVGTEHDLQTLKIGNQELENWLRSFLSKNVEFSFETVSCPEGNVGVLSIRKAENFPVAFKKIEYIRIGSYTQKLQDYPSVQAQLWDKLRNDHFEDRYAKQDLELLDAVNMLDYPIYFDLMNISQPIDLNNIAHYLIQENCIAKQDDGLYAITNLGAILFAKRLSDFGRLSRKAIRIVQYEGNSRLNLLKDETETKGYVSGFENAMKYIEALLPSAEVVVGSIREKRSAYPMLAIREIVANALIHQDFNVVGTGPTIEIFSNRIEITNSGTSLVEIPRIIDNPPKSRNEKLASLMRRLRMCEELGTGWDKIVISCEVRQLPTPKIDIFEDSTRVTIYSEIPYSSLSMDDRLWACYMHACVKYVQGEPINNSSLRQRFGLKESSSGSISRLIKEALSENLIKPLDSETAPRYMKYIPYWA